MCMLMFKRFSGVLGTGALTICLLAGGSAFALDANPKSKTASVAPLELFKNPRAALQRGIETYRKGDVANSVAALKYAADGGEALAQWKLGRMYAAGEGVPKDDVEAFNYFARIVRDYKEDQLDPRDSSVVASAFVAVGVYSLSGIQKSHIHQNLQRAMHMFHYAATVFRNADAQYNLARMYLDGAGAKRDPRQAVPWLRYAAEKNHIEALAVLGNLLFSGDSGVARQRARGLMYLTLAREIAQSRQKLAWVVDLHSQSVKAASDYDKQMAHVELKKYLRWRARR